MNEQKTPLDWARLAVAAATIKASEVTVVEYDTSRGLRTITIGDTTIYRVSVRGAWAWEIGIHTYSNLAEALAEAVSQEVYRRVEEALGQAGLAT